MFIGLDQDTVQWRVLVCWLIWIRILYSDGYLCADCSGSGHCTVTGTCVLIDLDQDTVQWRVLVC